MMLHDKNKKINDINSPTLRQKINDTTMEFHFAEQVTSEYGHGHITRGGPEESIHI